VNAPHFPQDPQSSPPGYQPPAGYRLVPEGQPQGYAPPPIIINNVTSASAAASAAASAGAWGARRRRQSLWAHVVLFLFTAGIGNIVYAWYVINWNRKRGL
jgi:hypothetical protein